MSRPLCIILTAALTLTGCGMANTQEVQYDDQRNPFYKQATQDLGNDNFAAAAGDYEAALGANPKLTEAHLQLGHLYGEKLNDPIGAIFHFQQYLKLAPASEKTDEVKALVDKQSQAFAASLPNSPAQSADDYAKLQADNASFKKQLEDATRTITQLQAQLALTGKHRVADTAPVSAPAPPLAGDNSNPNAPAPPAPAVPASTNAAAASPPRALPLDATNVIATPAAPGVPTGPTRTYTVAKGDSIWKIAHKMYPGDTKNGVDKIQEANKDAIGGKPLKIGQVLIIPQ